MNQINGLPAHILLVHAVIVLVPLTALLVLLHAFWAASRQRLVWPTLIAASLSLALNALAMHAGEWLQQRVPDTRLVRAHTKLGDTLLPWTVGLFLLSAATAAWHVRANRASLPADGSATVPTADAAAGSIGVAARGRMAGTTVVVAPSRAMPAEVADGKPGVFLRIAYPAVAVVIAAGALVQTYRIGESGARAVWHDNFSQEPISGR